MKKFLIYSTILILSFAQLNAQSLRQQINLIPKPTNISIREGYFQINDSTKILFDKESENLAIYLVDILRPSTGY
jgi:hypothetical protein